MGFGLLAVELARNEIACARLGGIGMGRWDED